jgi:hypothetical protein
MSSACAQSILTYQSAFHLVPATKVCLRGVHVAKVLSRESHLVASQVLLCNDTISAQLLTFEVPLTSIQCELFEFQMRLVSSAYRCSRQRRHCVRAYASPAGPVAPSCGSREAAISSALSCDQVSRGDQNSYFTEFTEPFQACGVNRPGLP